MKEELFEKYKEHLISFFSKSQINKLLTRLERISCKIAPLNTSTGNTQTIYRWELPQDSPQYASEEECKKIFDNLLNDLLGLLGVSDFEVHDYIKYSKEEIFNKESVIKMLEGSSRIGSLELPIDYKISLNKDGEHAHDNIFWCSPLKAINKLREWVDNKNIITKIQVKSYLTDRRQTGNYQTNREVRWEANPKSPQFAPRQDCFEIESKLLSQISTFVGAPDLPEELIPMVEKALGGKYEKNSFRCPISGKPILYNEFFEKVSSPTHGRSGFQVGHLNPLATTGGHNSGNVSWITDLGNRVQGDSSLEEIANEIFYMADFHRERLGLSWEKVDNVIKKMKD